MIPVCVAVFFLPDNILIADNRNIVGAIIFALAAMTDWLDGFLARRLRQTSAFGAFLDPVADKLIVTAALILLVDLHRLAGWMAMFIIGREIAISALREWMAEIGGRQSVAVAYIGKLKTAVQMAAILLLLYAGPIVPGVNTLLLGNLCMIVAVILTLWSMVYYLRVAAREFTGKKIDR